MSDAIPTRHCTACEQEFPMTLEFFHRLKKRKDGSYSLRSQCKECANRTHREQRNRTEIKEREHAYNKAWREKNREYDSERQKKYRQENYEKVRSRERQYDKEHREEKRAYSRKWHAEHPRRDRTEWGKAYRAAHKQEIMQRIKRWREANPERVRLYARQKYQRNRLTRPLLIQKENERKRRYYHEHREERRAAWREYARQNKLRLNEHSREWQRANLTRHAISESNRRARKKQIDGVYTTSHIQEQLKRQKYRCYYATCGHAKFQKVNGNYIYHIEHTFPISRVAGTTIPANDISYIVLACPTCNMRKGDKFPWEFPEGGKLL